MNITNIKPCGGDAEGMPERIVVEFDDGNEIWERIYIAQEADVARDVKLYLASSLDTGSISFPRLICPRCNKAVPYEVVGDDTGKAIYKPKYPHCPYCGVKVDETGYGSECW